MERYRDELKKRAKLRSLKRDVLSTIPLGPDRAISLGAVYGRFPRRSRELIYSALEELALEDGELVVEEYAGQLLFHRRATRGQASVARNRNAYKRVSVAPGLELGLQSHRT